MSQRPARQHAGHRSGNDLLRETVRRHAVAPDSERNVLNLIPVPLWIEDFSDIKRRIDHFVHEGVANLREHLENRPQEVFALLGMIRTLWVNDATLSLYEAADRAPFQGHLHRIFGEETYEVLKEQIVALADGRTEFIRETVLTTPRGGQKNILLHAKVDPAHQADLSRVFMTLTDVTSVKPPHKYPKGAESLYRRAFESAPIPMMLVDAGLGVIIDTNRSLQHLLGAPPHAIAGLPIGKLCPESKDARGTDSLVNLIAGKQTLIERLRLRRADGTELQVAVASRTVQPGDQRCALLAFYPPGSDTLPWERRTRVDRRAPAPARELLTKRERQILILIATGHTNQTIADTLKISRKTVETHRLRLMQKLDIHKATDLVRYAMTSGLLASS
jgi:PAS domain S-box-containing protein